jgi:LysR family transcriptional regulator for bpeEF and oprC
MTKIHSSLDTKAMMVFLQAARAGSFTLAAERLNMTPSAVSKSISRLETELGATLLRRNPRSVTLTPEGTRFFKEAEQLSLAIERARGAVAARSNNAQSRLRVTLPMHFGRTQVLPHLPRFLERHPEVRAEYLLINGQLDPIEHGIDIALWFSAGAWIDSRLVITNAATFATVLCAAPAYLERYGTPGKIIELDQHRTLGGVDEKTGRLLPWIFNDGNRQFLHQPQVSVASNSIDLIFSMALDGCGIVYLPDYLADEAVRQGHLRIILPNYQLEPSIAQIVHARARSGDPEVIAFIALLTQIIQMRRADLAFTRR